MASLIKAIVMAVRYNGRLCGGLEGLLQGKLSRYTSDEIKGALPTGSLILAHSDPRCHGRHSPTEGIWLR
jgi:hypothetical protein